MTTAVQPGNLVRQSDLQVLGLPEETKAFWPEKQSLPSTRWKVPVGTEGEGDCAGDGACTEACPARSARRYTVWLGLLRRLAPHSGLLRKKHMLPQITTATQSRYLYRHSDLQSATCPILW